MGDADREVLRDGRNIASAILGTWLSCERWSDNWKPIFAQSKSTYMCLSVWDIGGEVMEEMVVTVSILDTICPSVWYPFISRR